MDTLITPKELSLRWQLSRLWVYRYALLARGSDRIPHTWVGGRLRFRPSELVTYLDAHTVPGEMD